MKKIIFVLAAFSIFSLSKIYGQKLSRAAEWGNLEKAKLLIEQGANVNEHSKGRCFPLRYAVYGSILRQDAKIVDLLLKNGAKFDPCPDEHNTNTSLYNEIKSNLTPFDMAIVYNKLDIVKLFCDYGYNFSKKTRELDYTYPIIYALELGSVDIFNFLLDKGADVTVKDCYGKGALMYSIKANNLELAYNLLKKGCSIKDTSNNGYTPLMLAAEVSGTKTDLFNFLINSGADVNYTNKKNQSAYSIACFHNNRSLAISLLKNGFVFKPLDLDFETVARMYQFTGEALLDKGDANTSIEYFDKAKMNYEKAIVGLKKDLSSVNRLKLGKDILETLANSYVEANKAMVLGKLYRAPYEYKTYPKYYQKDKSKILTIDYQLPEGANLEEKKAFYKNKIAQNEMSISLMKGMIGCIDKGLTGKELEDCLDLIQLIN